MQLLKIVALAAAVALSACGSSEEPAGKAMASEPGRTQIEPAAVQKMDITKFFGTQKDFCEYMNLDILSPGVASGPIQSTLSESMWEGSISKFSAQLHGLNVVATAEYRAEGVGGKAIIFEDSNATVLSTLGKIYADSFPTSILGEGAMWCPECEYAGDHPRFTALQNETETLNHYGIGKSAVLCGFFD